MNSKVESNVLKEVGDVCDVFIGYAKLKHRNRNLKIGQIMDSFR